MRVVQIIDSLDAGGAERMAVNNANALLNKIEFSGLVATRKEGKLKKQLDSNVSYLFLEKKKSIDFSAVFKLRNYIKKNRVDFIHAHSSSFFIAILIKLTLPGVKIIWHDHYGSRIKESVRQNKTLIACSFFFSSILVVNPKLEQWNKKNMRCKKVFFIPNFTPATVNELPSTILKGKEGKRIVFLANLKNPKNHIQVLKVFRDLKLKESGWSLHLIGKDFFDDYSNLLKNFIETYSLGNDIHLYDEQNDIKNILSQANIGILASTDEGFPVTLLEYALSGLAVISTNVGYCSDIIKEGITGLLFNPFSEIKMKNQLMKLIGDELLIKEFGINFKQSVIESYSEERVIDVLISAYKKSK
ncbi:alpha-1,4-N-acetylgalactosamine transferase [Flavobacterium tructae]|uniref:glycosyltransferase n=1 Tax=Flavobacterium tructae TaxID=1114873 RepID=UPI000B5B994A|nr:glycosyltransferase [Flavobacterium tructae]OXB20792.1 alpha-1,4-N-acetylgalactosamine transferase [Flavobacterium tructae]